MSADIFSQIIKFNAQTNGRDKLCSTPSLQQHALGDKIFVCCSEGVAQERLFQYSCRLAWGRAEGRPDKKDLIRTLKAIESVLSMTRKLLRFGKSLDFLQGALKSIHLKDTVLQLTITLSKINQAFYLLFDHFLWFNNVGAVKLDKQYWSEVSSRFYLATLLLNLMRDLYGVWCVVREEIAKYKARTTSSVYLNGDSNYKSVSKRQSTFLELMAEHKALVLDTIKNFFDLAIPMSTLKMVKLTPTQQGAFGIISSAVAVATVWNPNLKLVP